MTIGEVVSETEFTQTIEMAAGGGPSYTKRTKKCVFCETPREDWDERDFPKHLLACPEAPR